MTLLGVLLIVFGVLVILVPQILIAMVAAVFIMTGLLLCVTSWQWRRVSRRHSNTITEWFLRF